MFEWRSWHHSICPPLLLPLNAAVRASVHVITHSNRPIPSPPLPAAHCIIAQSLVSGASCFHRIHWCYSSFSMKTMNQRVGACQAYPVWAEANRIGLQGLWRHASTLKCVCVCVCVRSCRRAAVVSNQLWFWIIINNCMSAILLIRSPFLFLWMPLGIISNQGTTVDPCDNIFTLQLLGCLYCNYTLISWHLCLAAKTCNSLPQSI